MSEIEEATQRRKYESVVRQIADLPSLPEVINRVVQELGKPDASAQEIAYLISYDPGLTSKILRIVNSAAYGFQRQISSVQHAIMILGFNTLRGLVLSASIFRMFDAKHPHGLNANAFWRHSIETAVASRVIANYYDIPYAEDAFSAGMLHDIGKMVLDYHFRDDYKTVLQAAGLGRIPTHGPNFLHLEDRVLEINHAEIGYELAQRWKLPASFAEVVRYHHTPEEATAVPELVYTVALANAFSHLIQLNYGVFNVQYLSPFLIDHFQIDAENPEGIIELYNAVCAEMDSVGQLLTSLRR